MKYIVNLGFKHWETYRIEASSKEEAIQKAEEKNNNGDDCLNWTEDRWSEIDEVKEDA